MALMTSTTSPELRIQTVELAATRFPLERCLYYLLAAVALIYAFAAGLKTIADFDLGWQMATGRWIMQHHQIPSTDVLSYTAAGQPWIYPVGSGLIFYGLFLVGGYALLSWLGAAACVGTVALLLRRGSAITAGLTLLAIPLIASRTTARAEVFTVVLFAAALSILWKQYETGCARLWILPMLMVAWVNLHPGFVAGLGLLGAYVMLEALGMLDPGKRVEAAARLRRSAPWLLATCAVTLVNPWGWGVYQVLLRQEGAMADHSQLILEWAPVPINWAHILAGLSLRDPDEFYVLFLIVILAIPIALARRQIGAAILMAGALFFPLRHARFTALFSIVIVVVGGAVLAAFARKFQHKIPGVRTGKILAIAAALLLAGLAVMRGSNLITDRFYRSGTDTASFGAGLSWWFPEKAAAFLERENIPGQIFNSYSEGGFIAWGLGEKYRDYIDGRAIPFGADQMQRASLLMASPPDSALWKQEAARYDINAIVVPLGRYNALQFFPTLQRFCTSEDWRPVYLDEVSAVFVRRGPKTQALIDRWPVSCSYAPLPLVAPTESDSKAFNQWANAAAVLKALGRIPEAFTATMKALAIFPDSAYLHFLRGHMYQDTGDMQNAEQDYLLATKLEPRLVAPWSALAAYYESQGRLPAAIRAWETAANVSRWPWEPLQSLGYANLQARRPKEALEAFNRAANSLPSQSDLLVDNNFLANIAHGRARAWDHLGDLDRAIFFEAQAAQLLPGSADLWSQLAALYQRAGRTEEASQARAHSQALSQQY